MEEIIFNNDALYPTCYPQAMTNFKSRRMPIMAKMLGDDGVFFKSSNMETLADRYKNVWPLTRCYTLAALPDPDAMPYPRSYGGRYIQKRHCEFIINFIVDNLNGALARVNEQRDEIVDVFRSYSMACLDCFGSIPRAAR